MNTKTLIDILFSLLSGNRINAGKIADKYGICRRTAYRYIDELSISGIPLNVEYGSNGGYSIPDTYRIPAAYLSRSELAAALSAINAVAAELHDQNLLTAADKLSAAARPGNAALTLSSGNLIIDAGPWGNSGGYSAKLQVIRRCIEENTVLRLRYHDREGETTERETEPHTLLLKQGLWYVYAYCRLRNNFRLFKIGRIEQATVTDKTFSRREIDVKSLTDWYGTVKTVEVTMEITERVLADVEEWLGTENIRFANGKYTACVRLPNDTGLVSKILTYGSGLKVLAPDSLKRQLKKAADEIADIYAN